MASFIAEKSRFSALLGPLKKNFKKSKIVLAFIWECAKLYGWLDKYKTNTGKGWQGCYDKKQEITLMRKIPINLDRVESGPNLKVPGRPSTVYADRIDLLRARVDILTGRDKALMTMYLENGNTFGQMARIAGVNETTIARRIYRLTRRLLNAGYITCLRNRHRLNKLDQLVARDYFIEGISQEKIARKRNVSVYAVRKALRNIQELIRTTNENST